MEKRTEPSAESGRPRGRPSTCGARTGGGRSRPRGERAQLSPIGSGPARVSGPHRARASRSKRRVGSRVGSFENAARSRVDRPIRGSTPTARPTANKYREGKLKRTLKRESKRTRNRPKEKKPRGRAGVRPGRSVADGAVLSRDDVPRPSLTVVEEGRDRLGAGTEVAPSRNRPPPRAAFGDASFRSLVRVWESDRRPVRDAQSAAHSAAALATRLETRTEESNACASKEKKYTRSLDAKRRRANEKPLAARVGSGPDRKWGRVPRLFGGATKRGSNRSAFARTRKMVNYARAGRSRTKVRWKAAAILTCKSIVRPKRRGERPIEPSNSWFPPKFPSG